MRNKKRRHLIKIIQQTFKEGEELMHTHVYIHPRHVKYQDKMPHSQLKQLSKYRLMMKQSAGQYNEEGTSKEPPRII